MLTNFKYSLTLVLLCILSSCISTPIQDGASLSETELAYLQELKLLDDDEEVILFSSNFNFESSGNFITNKRVASYWITGNIHEKNYAFYKNVDSIIVTYGSGTVTTKINVIKIKGKAFEVYIDDDKAREEEFVNQLNEFIALAKDQ